MIRDVRGAFFERAEDIGQIEVLLTLLEQNDVPREPVERALRDGTALGELSRDFMYKDKLAVTGSPTYVLDGGREKLSGNVGYRIVEANVSELLEAADGEECGASWC